MYNVVVMLWMLVMDSMSFLVELLAFMATMLLYITTVSMYAVVVLWEYLGLLSYVLIQHWGCRSIATLSSTKSILYNKLLDVLVLSIAAAVHGDALVPNELVVYWDMTSASACPNTMSRATSAPYAIGVLVAMVMIGAMVVLEDVCPSSGMVTAYTATTGSEDLRI